MTVVTCVFEIYASYLLDPTHTHHRLLPARVVPFPQLSVPSHLIHIVIIAHMRVVTLGWHSECTSVFVLLEREISGEKLEERHDEVLLEVFIEGCGVLQLGRGASSAHGGGLNARAAPCGILQCLALFFFLPGLRLKSDLQWRTQRLSAAVRKMCVRTLE